MNACIEMRIMGPADVRESLAKQVIDELKTAWAVKTQFTEKPRELVVIIEIKEPS